MGPLTEEEEFLPADHPMSQNTKILTERFGGASDYASLKIVIHFGVQDINKEDVSMWRSDQIGSAMFDPFFKISSIEAQQSILDLCSDLRT